MVKKIYGEISFRLGYKEAKEAETKFDWGTSLKAVLLDDGGTYTLLCSEKDEWDEDYRVVMKQAEASSFVVPMLVGYYENGKTQTKVKVEMVQISQDIWWGEWTENGFTGAFEFVVD